MNEDTHMRVLILGGTRFVGRHLVEAALAAGHDVTLFNRGRTNPDLFPSAEKLRGDRDYDAGALRGRSWDCVIDVSAYWPHQIAVTGQSLASSVGHYTFISSVSAYASFDREGLDESHPRAAFDEATIRDRSQESYGARKAACEAAVEEMFEGRCAILRPCIVVGPHDHTDRFAYWACRMSEPGRVLAPGAADAPVQFVDVRDLATWTVSVSRRGVSGIFNVTGPEGRFTWGKMLGVMSEVGGRVASPVWVDERFLAGRGVDPGRDLPFWVPSGEAPGFMTIDASAASAAGLRHRPVVETVADTLDWRRTVESPLVAGLSRERERELLRIWQARRS